MDNIQQNNGAIPTTPPPPITEGRWEQVDAASLGIDVSNVKPNEKFLGPDGSLYCVAQTAPQLTSIYGGQQSAVPTPSNIVQMPPIVQPIALVPYATQNQPMLQYDPYATPFDVKQQVEPTRYVKKAYRPLSVITLLVVLVGLVAVLAFAVADGLFKSTGLDMITSFMSTVNKGTDGVYYTAKIQPFISDIAESFGRDFMSTLVSLGIPVMVVLIVLFSAILIIKYIIKAGTSKTPRCFSLLALLNTVMALGILVGLFSMSRGEAEETTLVTFLNGQAIIFAGIGALVVFVTSALSFILPFFARKNAYIMATPNSKKVYIIN